MTTAYTRNEISFDALSQALQNFQLRVLEAGEIITHTNHTNEKPFDHLFRLNYIVKGHVHLICCGRNWTIPEGNLLFLTPEQMETIDEDAEEVHVMFINFEAGNLDQREAFISFMHNLLPEHSIYDPKNILYNYFRMILEEQQNCLNGYGLMIDNIFRLFFIQMSRMKQGTVNAGRELTHAEHALSLYNEAVNYIARHTSENIRISELAEYLSVSEIYLYKIFMTYANCSPKEYIIRYRMELAKSYLRLSSAPVKSISDSLGYPMPSSFSAAFKKETGVSPAEFRKQNRDH